MPSVGFPGIAAHKPNCVVRSLAEVSNFSSETAPVPLQLSHSISERCRRSWLLLFNLITISAYPHRRPRKPPETIAAATLSCLCGNGPLCPGKALTHSNMMNVKMAEENDSF